MSTDLATIGLTYDLADIQDQDLGIFLEITQGLHEPPEVRGRDVVVPSLAGQVARNRVVHQLKIVLTGIVRGNGASQASRHTDFRSQSLFLRTLFSPARLPAELVATLEIGSQATIQARPINTIWNEVVKSEFAYVSVELLALEDWDFSGMGS